MATVLLVSNTAWSIANFRGGLIAMLQAEGHRVVAAAPEDGHGARIRAMGCEYIPLPMDNKGTNPLNDLLLVFRLLRLLRKCEAGCILTFTIKPNIYGALAARMLGIPAVCNITGLGTAYMDAGLLGRFVNRLYQLGVRSAHRIFFQNRDDMTLFLQDGRVPRGACELLPGSGVNVGWFAPAACPAPQRAAFRFLLFGRLLWTKGIGEYVEAARIFRSQGAPAQFHLLGFAGVANRLAVSRRQIDAWERTGLVQYLGEAIDVRPYLAAADCVVLPSYYREGVPRSLLEASSMGIPVITTTTPGCREAVEHEATGFLVPPRDVGALIRAMQAMMTLPLQARGDMGSRGRHKIIREFDEQFVLARYREVVAGACRPARVQQAAPDVNLPW